eukprot:g5560.t1
MHLRQIRCRAVLETVIGKLRTISNPEGNYQLIWIRQQSNGDSNKSNFLTSVSGIKEDSKGSLEGTGNGKPPSGSNKKGRSKNSKANSSDKEEDVVVLKPEDKFRKVLAVELNRRPLMPGTAIPVVVSNPKLIEELTEQQKAGGALYVGAFLRRPGTGEELLTISEFEKDVTIDPADHLYDIGTFAQVHVIIPGGDVSGITHLMLLGHKRIRRMTTVSSDPLRVTIQTLKDKPHKATDHMKALTMEIISTMRDLFHLHPLYTEQLKSLQAFGVGANMSNVSRLADIGAGISSVLEELHVPTRAQKVLELLKKEIDLVKLQQQIGKRVEEKITKDQRRYFLMEQLKSIKKELGLEKDDKSTLTQKFRDKFSKFESKAPKEAQVVIEEEIEKLNALEPASSEFNVTRNYLDWLTSIPWGTYSEEKLDVDHARSILDEDHYGLKDVKDRILEFIAVGLLKGSTQGKILCLVGPPGVGKTSIGSSIARALNRSYFRFSVGGLSDVAEIKGHRRTYVGAMPGKMVQCLKSTSTSNPFVCIDEIDKLGRGYQGDPASALLELLDPEQNSKFLDHYLDVPVDLSKVLFMCTANVLDTIPSPLLDRMEVIRISGYISNEKVAIARRYLEPQTQKATGVPQDSVRIEDDAMNALIADYCREAGVRNLKKQIEKIYRKCALKLVNAGAKGPLQIQQEQQSTQSTESVESEAQEEKPLPPAEYHGDPIVVSSTSLHDLIGSAPFKSDRIYQKTPVGVVVGLAWTAMGGSTLYAEAAVAEKQEGKGGLKSTGQLGDVMKESTAIAHTFAKGFLLEKDPKNRFFYDSLVHIHFPEGATPKDGPSAGITLVTALLSLSLEKSVKPDLAMTGELTLTGKVLPVGGIKEKTIAAKRSEIKHLLFPQGNLKDVEELDEEIKKDLDIHFVNTYSDVFNFAFEDNS